MGADGNLFALGGVVASAVELVVVWQDHGDHASQGTADRLQHLRSKFDVLLDVIDLFGG